MVCPRKVYFVSGLTFIYECRTPYASVSELDCRARSAGRLEIVQYVSGAYRTCFHLSWPNERLMGVPHLRTTCQQRDGAAMCGCGVLVHRLSRLGAAVAVMAAEIPCGDGVFTKWALEHAKAGHHCDGVISHNFKCSRIFRCNSELKLPSPLINNESLCWGSLPALFLCRSESAESAPWVRAFRSPAFPFHASYCMQALEDNH